MRGLKIQGKMTIFTLIGSLFMLLVWASPFFLASFATRLAVTIFIIVLNLIFGTMLSRSIQNGVKVALAAGREIAEKDFTATAGNKHFSDDELGQLNQAIYDTAAALNGTLSEIKGVSGQVKAEAERVSTSAEILSQGASEQASTIEELSYSVTVVSEKMNENAVNVQDVREAMGGAMKEVKATNQMMSELYQTMGNIYAASNKIKTINKTIDDIAFQTNILALNAAVEAARAGAAGKGFSVVADEVRNLAGRSAAAAKETSELIDASLEKINDGFTMSEKTTESSGKMYKQLQRIDDEMNEMDEAAAGQAASVAQITQGIEQISKVVQDNTSMAEESAASSKELSQLSTLLYRLVSDFRLREE